MSQQEQDRQDLHLETAGLEVGRIKRFLPEDARPDPGGKRAEQNERALSRLMILLQSNAAYAALYRETMEQLRRAEAAAAAALAKHTEIVKQTDAALEEARDGASTLPDGTRVYRDANDNAWTEDGRQITGDSLEGIVWREGAVSYEEFLARRKAAEEARRVVEDIRRYQVDVLGRSRDRITDDDNPPSETELEEINKRIEAEMPSEVKAIIEPPGPRAEMNAQDMSGLKLPPNGK